jgi:hypothetical protein
MTQDTNADSAVWIWDPPEEFRMEISNRAQDIPGGPEINSKMEDLVEQLLSRVEEVARGALTQDVPDIYLDEPDDIRGDRLFSAVNAWASIASYVTAKLYAPQSPLRSGLAGWSTKIDTQLQRIVRVLLGPLRTAARLIGALSWSIAVSFPWAGVQVGLGWEM